mmetsp:Transcript_22919/g.40553  ORF Transcript_22919/g.40553 Transcript_22919/m.40553 type:complete len:292 (+) Transcript_22919:1363-2238(+)
MDADVALLVVERLARRHLDHLLHQVHVGDHLGDRVLDLQPGVHFQEVKVAMLVHQELHSARALVVDGLGELQRLLAHRLAHLRRDEHGGRLLDHLLVAPLDRALALVEVDAVAVLVDQHLDFDVPRLLHELLDEDRVVSERRQGLTLRQPETRHRLIVAVRNAHALSPAARRCLDHDWIADVVGHPQQLLLVRDLAHVAGNDVDFGLLCDLLGVNLVSHGVDGELAWPDERHATSLQRLRKLGVFGEKPVPRMHGLGSGGLDGGEDAVHSEVGVTRGRWPHAHGFVGHRYK